MFNRGRIPKDNFPDEYESRVFQQYRETFQPGLVLKLREWSSQLLFAGLVFLFASLGLSVAWIALPPEELTIIIVTPDYTPAPPAESGDIAGDFPAGIPQQFIQVPAKVDHEVFSVGERHAYRFILEPTLTWTFTVTGDGNFDPKASLYGPDGVLVQMNDDIQIGVDLRSQFTYTPPARGQYALLIESTGDRPTTGGYTLQIMPVR